MVSMKGAGECLTTLQRREREMGREALSLPTSTLRARRPCGGEGQLDFPTRPRANGHRRGGAHRHFTAAEKPAGPR